MRAGRQYRINELQNSPPFPTQNGIEGALHGGQPWLNGAGGQNNTCIGLGIHQLLSKENAGNISNRLKLVSAPGPRD